MNIEKANRLTFEEIKHFNDCKRMAWGVSLSWVLG